MRVALVVGVVAVVATLGLASGAAAQASAGQQPIDFAEGSFRLPSQDWSVPQRDLGRYAGGAVQAVRQVPGHDLLLNVQVKGGGRASSADDLLATLGSANSESAGGDWVVDFATE